MRQSDHELGLIIATKNEDLLVRVQRLSFRKILQSRISHSPFMLQELNSNLSDP